MLSEFSREQIKGIAMTTKFRQKYAKIAIF